MALESLSNKEDNKMIDDNIKQNMQEEQEQAIHPEQYVLQTLDDAALVLTVCRMSLDKMNTPLMSQVHEFQSRLRTVRGLLDAVDETVAQWYTDKKIVVDSSIEGN